MAADPQAPAPVLVLGLGNPLLRDDAVGLTLAEALAGAAGPDVEVLDGGTQGLALCGRLAGRRALLVLDAVRLGAPPGTVHRLDDPLAHRPPRGEGAHEANAGDLLATAALLGDLPEHVVVVGVEPAEVRTGVGLSPPVERAVPAALRAAEQALAELRAQVGGRRPCTS